jgi:hypothetical protein
MSPTESNSSRVGLRLLAASVAIFVGVAAAVIAINLIRGVL